MRIAAWLTFAAAAQSALAQSATATAAGADAAAPANPAAGLRAATPAGSAAEQSLPAVKVNATAVPDSPLHLDTPV